MSKLKQKGGLGGRGLNALLGALETGEHETLQYLAVDRLVVGRYQPRTHMDADALQELAASIKEQGLMQPILVRPQGVDCYEIIAGERRWRASQLAGLQEVPVLVREVGDEATAAMALIENIQREDLNPLEEARAMARLIAELGLTHEQVADKIGRSRSAVSNTLRLLQLVAEVQNLLETGQLEMGHARALLPLPLDAQLRCAQKVIAQALTVRATEALVKQILHSNDVEVQKPAPVAAPAHDFAQDLNRLTQKIHLPVRIKPNKDGGGKVSIQCKDAEELQRFFALLAE